MNSELAAIYGTGNYEPQESDIEKTAAAELLVKLAEEEGTDLNQFSDQEIAQMIDSLYKSAAEAYKGKETPAEEEAEEEGKKNKEEKKKEAAAEADFLGRVMAHSMVHELREIEKQAAGFTDSQAAKFLENHPLGSGAMHGPVPPGKLTMLGRKGVDTTKALLDIAKKNKKYSIPAALGLAAAGGYAALRGKKKESSADESAFEQLAAQRAFELAKEAGYVDENGNLLVQTKQASALDRALDARALQICEANGLPVQWNE